MTVTVTWQQDSSAPSTFTLAADLLASLDSYRQTLRAIQPVTAGNGTVSNQFLPLYPDVLSMIVGIFTELVVNPALAKFPTPAMQTALSNLATAQAAVAAAGAAALTTIPAASSASAPAAATPAASASPTTTSSNPPAAPAGGSQS